MHRKILVAYDFTDVAQRAMRWAVELLADGGGTLTLVYVQPMSPPVVGPEVLSPLPMVPPMDDMRAFEQRLRDAASLANTPADVHAIMAPSIGSAVVDHAQEIGADLIVVGTHGRGALARAILGSVADYVVRHATCPVVTVRDVHPPAPSV